MRKLQIEDAEVMRLAIQQEISRNEEARYDHRLHGMLLVTAGQSCREVARLFGEDATTVQRWVRRFEKGGLEALREGERPGRPRMLDARQWRKLATELRRTPRVSRWMPLCGTVHSSRSTWAAAIGSNWGCGNASAC